MDDLVDDPSGEVETGNAPGDAGGDARRAATVGVAGGAVAGGALGAILGPVGALGGALLGAVLGDEYVSRSRSASTDSLAEPAGGRAVPGPASPGPSARMQPSAATGGMQDIVQSALEDPEDPEDVEDAGNLPDPDATAFGDPRVVIVGCGGAGNNMVNRLANLGVAGAETVVLNTDRQHLNVVQADTKVLIGESVTEGFGAGGDPAKGEKAAEAAADTVREVIGDADLVFVAAGMGGGTGTGAAPVVAEIAGDAGAIVVGVVAMPFEVEAEREAAARTGLERLSRHADSVIVMDNDKLLDYAPNVPLGKALSRMDRSVAETIRAITETITQPSLINLDYADMASMMERGGVSVIFVGEARNGDDVDEAVRSAMTHPFLDVEYRGASGALVHVTGGPELTLEDAEAVAAGIADRLEPDATVVWGARIREDFDDRVRVTGILTGFDRTEWDEALAGESGDDGETATGPDPSDEAE